MSTKRFEPSTIKNKVKRQEVARKHKREKGQKKLQARLAQAKAEANDPAAKQVRESMYYLTTNLIGKHRNGLRRMSQKPWIIPVNSTLQ